MLLASGSLAGRLEAIPRLAKRRWQCSTSSRKKISALAPVCWAGVSASVRGSGRGAVGAMQALELVRSKTTREPADEETKQVSQYCYEHGLVLITAGSYGNVIRLLMPLVVTDAQMDEAMDVLEAALAYVAEKKSVLTAQLT